MTWIAISLLFMALIWAIERIWAQRVAIKRLNQALERGKPFLREDMPNATAPGWDELTSRTNNLLAELARTQRQRSSQVAQINATLGSLREAVLVVDSNNYVLLANQALQEIFPGVENILGKRLELVLHSVDFFEYMDQVRINGSLPQRTFEFVDGDRVVWLEVTGTRMTPLDGQSSQLSLFVLHDITKQKALEGVRKDFVANVSHELRTPLSVIKGYVETLVDGHENMSTSERIHFLKTIQRHAERLHAILEDLLTLSRLESINPGLQRESVDMIVLTKSISDEYRSRPTATNHIIALSIEGKPKPYILDPLKITQVFENLLDNALKYTPAGSKIEILLKDDPDALELHIKDNGPGIPEADLPHIFERFYRVDKGRSRENGGTGLGLSIVKHIVQLHGGKVRCDSRLGEGACFTFTLPKRGHYGAP